MILRMYFVGAVRRGNFSDHVYFEFGHLEANGLGEKWYFIAFFPLCLNVIQALVIAVWIVAAWRRTQGAP